jgi:hypothetical protein
VVACPFGLIVAETSAELAVRPLAGPVVTIGAPAAFTLEANGTAAPIPTIASNEISSLDRKADERFERKARLWYRLKRCQITDDGQRNVS